MKTSHFLAALAAAIFGAALPAMAGPRTFVSGLGNDANPGTREQPKRTFASALTVTDARGEIVPLDSAGYGVVAINKSVTIAAPPGIYAGVTVSSGTGILVYAPSSDTVVLRGLTIDGVGNFANGIYLSQGATLHVENCVIADFYVNNSVGILIAGYPGKLFVKDTIVRGNYSGITAQAGTTSLDHVRIEKNSVYGLFVNASSAIVTIGNSVASENGSGMWVANGQLNVESCQIAHNAAGIASINSSALVRVSNSTVTNNSGSGVFINAGSTMETRRNNTIRGNNPNVNGALTFISGN